MFLHIDLSILRAQNALTNLFGLTEPRPSPHGEPAGAMPTATAIDYQTPMLHQKAPGNVTLLDGVRGLTAPRPTVMGEPQEVPRGATTATRQPPSVTGAPQVLPDTDLCLRDARPQTASVDDGATALRDRCLAEYEARLNHSQARPTATMEIGDQRLDPMVAADGGILRGAGHGHLLHPSCASRPSRLVANVTDRPCARLQQRAQKLNWTSTRPLDAIYGDVHYRERGLEQEGPVLSRQFAPRPRYQASLETPDDASEKDAQNPEFMPLPRGMGTQPQPPRYSDIGHHGKRLSCRDWYEMPYRAPQQCEPHTRPHRYEAPQHFEGAYVPARANPVAHLAKMKRLPGRGKRQVGLFLWSHRRVGWLLSLGRARNVPSGMYHLRGTALAYVKQAPFQPRRWEELKALLLKRFQPCDLMAMYKAQFCSRRGRYNEDMHTYVEAFQRLADMAWPFMDAQAKEELVVDQFLMGMESHDLSVQVAAYGHFRMEDVPCVTRSLESVHEEERHAPRSRKPAT